MLRKHPENKGKNECFLQHVFNLTLSFWGLLPIFNTEYPISNLQRQTSSWLEAFTPPRQRILILYYMVNLFSLTPLLRDEGN